MNPENQAELKKQVASLNWLLTQLPAAPTANPPAADVFALVDQPMTQSDILNSLRFHAGRILEITQ